MEFSRREYWSGLLFPSPGDLPDPGIKSGFPALETDCLPSEPPEGSERPLGAATGKALTPFLGDWSLGGHGGEVGSRGP